MPDALMHNTDYYGYMCDDCEKTIRVFRYFRVTNEWLCEHQTGVLYTPEQVHITGTTGFTYTPSPRFLNRFVLSRGDV